MRKNTQGLSHYFARSQALADRPTPTRTAAWYLHSYSYHNVRRLVKRGKGAIHGNETRTIFVLIGIRIDELERAITVFDWRMPYLQIRERYGCQSREIDFVPISCDKNPRLILALPSNFAVMVRENSQELCMTSCCALYRIIQRVWKISCLQCSPDYKCNQLPSMRARRHALAFV